MESEEREWLDKTSAVRCVPACRRHFMCELAVGDAALGCHSLTEINWPYIMQNAISQHMFTSQSHQMFTFISALASSTKKSYFPLFYMFLYGTFIAY